MWSSLWQVGGLLLCVLMVIFDSFTLISASNETAEFTNKSRTTLEKVLRPFPFHESGVPLDVLIAGVILDVGEVDCFKMEFKVSLLLRQSWRDARLPHSDASNGNVQLDSNNIQNFWTPDIFIANGRDVAQAKLSVKQTPDGRIVKSERITVTAKCRMKFGLYPFDHHHCFLEIQSYYWTEEELQYRLDAFEKEHGRRQGIQLDPEATSVSPFHIVDVHSEVSTASFNNENYSLFLVELRFRRLWISYFGTFYLSMASFVSLSLLSLWLVYPRISAIVNCFNIGLINIFLVLYKNNLDIPKIYYVTSMEIYSAFCVTFVVLVLLVNVYVLYYVKAEEEEEESRRIRREHQGLEFSTRSETRKPIVRTVSQPSPQTPQTADGSFSEDISTGNPSNWKIIKSNLMDKVRRNSHWTLLFGFIIFNAVYWVAMLTMHYAF